MVTWKMKNVFIHADIDLSNINPQNDNVKCYIIKKNNWILPDNDNNDTNFAIVDADINNDLSKFINTYKKFNTKFYAFTKNTSKANILNLYAQGFDNVIPAPKNINKLIDNIVNPENEEVSIKDANKYANSKKVLLLCKDNLNADLIIKTLEDFNFIYTIRNLCPTAENDIKKDKYDLIIVDSKGTNQFLTQIINKITQSKHNKNTPIILISDNLDNETDLKEQNLSHYYYIEKPYTNIVLQSQIKNILRIKELQDELKKENNLLENMITNSFSQLIITDTNFNVLSGGNQYIKITNNEYFFNTLREENIAFPKDEIRVFSRNAEKNFKFSTSYNDKTFEIVISKVFKDSEVCEQYLIIIDDITEKLLIEEQKETFIATLTHDLKSPIRAEQNILKQLLNGQFGTLTDTQKTIIKEILNSKEYENKMIENLLTRYHITSNTFKLFIEKNNYKETIETVLKEADHLFKDKMQEITVTYNAKTSNFEYDKTEIKRVLSNIIQNASEYTPKNGKISINVTETNEKIITSITDSGYGIKKEDLSHIFDKNVTLAKKYRKVGAGLGLYISKTLVNAHKGTITVESEVNKGSTFTFTLPKYQN